MKKFFYLDESPSNPGLFLIFPNHDRLPLEYTRGSFSILAARVLGLSPVNYLRLCRDVYGARLIGKHQKYPRAFFEDKKKAEELVSLLNEHMKEIMKGRK